MNKIKSILNVFFVYGIIAVIFLVLSKEMTYAQAVPVQIYQANPQTYSWTVVPPYNPPYETSQNQGKTYTNNKNPFGFETYSCPVLSQQVNSQKAVKDLCTSTATNQANGKLWSTTAMPNTTCNAQQKGFDGPWNSADTRYTNGTANSNANSSVCAGTTQGARANLPFLNITKQFTYSTAFCSGSNRVILGARSDPANPVCNNLNYDDIGNHPGNYSQDQLQCLMYVDNTADVTACKGGVCRTINFTGALGPNGQYVLAQAYANICSIFTQGNGVYDVTLKAYDIGGGSNGGGVMYGSSSFWLSTLDYLPYTISGNVFVDQNKNDLKDGSDTNYAAKPTIIASRGTVTTNTNGTYTITDVYPGAPVTVSYSSLPNGYNMQYPLNGPPPSFQVSVGSTNCSTNGASGATCNGGNVTNLNFGITNSFPWVQTVCGDYRADNGISNLVPAGKSASITNAACTQPGMLFTGDTTATFGQGQASSTSQVVGGATYPEVYTPPSTGGIFSSYTYLNQKAQTAGITPINLATVCTLANCTLPANLPHGLYLANGNVKLNTTQIPANQNYVFLINGDLTLGGNIDIPANTKTTAFFSASGNIIVPANVGSAANATTPNLEGVFSTDRSFIMQSNNNCTDLRLNLEGTLIVNAGRSGGTLQNNRDLCGNNPNFPTLQMTQRLDFILNLPDFLKTQSLTSQEVAP